MRIRNLLLAILLFSGIYARGAEVLQVSANNKVIAVSMEDGHTWKVRDNVCVYQVGQEAACGQVIKIIKQGAVVRLTNITSTVAKGDSAAFVATVPKRGVASTGESTETVSASAGKGYGWDITGGLSVGSNYFYPQISLQRTLGNHFALGLTPFYVSSSQNGSSVSAIGGLLTANY